MSSKKKVTPKPETPKARYTNGTKVFICCYAFAGPGVILEGEIKKVDTEIVPVLSDNGKITGNESYYSYLISTVKGEFSYAETNVYPSYFEAAKVFAKAFTRLLK